MYLQMKVQNHHNMGFYAKGNQSITHQSLSQNVSWHLRVPIRSSCNHSSPPTWTLAHHGAFLILPWSQHSCLLNAKIHRVPEKTQEEGHPHEVHFILGTSAKNFPTYSCLSQLVFPFLLCPFYTAKMPHQPCKSLTEESKKTPISCTFRAKCSWAYPWKKCCSVAACEPYGWELSDRGGLLAGSKYGEWGAWVTVCFTNLFSRYYS